MVGRGKNKKPVPVGQAGGAGGGRSKTTGGGAGGPNQPGSAQAPQTSQSAALRRFLEQKGEKTKRVNTVDSADADIIVPDPDPAAAGPGPSSRAQPKRTSATMDSAYEAAADDSSDDGDFEIMEDSADEYRPSGKELKEADRE